MKKIAVIGASSLTGEKLIEILSAHPKVKKGELALSLATSRSYVGQKVIGCDLLEYQSFDIEEVKSCDIIFSCLPHGNSMSILPQLLDGSKLIIDLGADFRQPAYVFEKWYGIKHLAKNQTPATYGLSEVFTQDIKKSNFIANPGCYPTSVLLALAPLLNAGLKLEDVSVFALSGRSGAGKKKAKDFEKLNKEILPPYKDEGGQSHQHIGEINYIASKLSKDQFNLLFFQPNVLPGVFAGMRTSIIAKCNSSLEELLEIFKKFYQGQPFIKIKMGSDFIFREVVATNNCLIGLDYNRVTKLIYLTSVIDNLMKGASGQAVQNMNLALGWEQTMGLK